MKKACSFLILLFLVIQSNAQFKTVRFEVLDKITKKPVSGVTAAPDFAGDSAVSNENGILLIKVPKGYHDSVTLSREDYYPLVSKVLKVPHGKTITVLMLFNPSNVDTLLFIDNAENRLAAGKVYHYYQGNWLDSVSLRLADHKILGYTDSKGEYMVAIPRSLDSLYLSLDGFWTAKVSGRKHGPFGLVPLNPGGTDIRRLQMKNVLSISPMELFRGGIGLRYERFVSKKHSVGFHGSYYFFNKTHYRKVMTPFGDEEILVIEEFDGIKLAPFYRYYFRKNVRGGPYVEAKPVAGYFYFPELIGYDKNPAYFWTFGIGASFGIMAVQSQKHFTVNFSVGGQYLPIKDPRNNFTENSFGWWYGIGPGSAIEIKFTFGGIF